MNAYIFQNVGNLTPNYHSDGGLVVIALDEEHAKDVIKEELEPGCGPNNSEWYDVITLHLADDDNQHPRAFVFPNAGCC